MPQNAFNYAPQNLTTINLTTINSTPLKLLDRVHHKEIRSRRQADHPRPDRKNMRNRPVPFLIRPAAMLVRLMSSGDIVTENDLNDGIHEGLSSAEVIWEENKAVRNIPTSCINFDRLFANCQKMAKFDS